MPVCRECNRAFRSFYGRKAHEVRNHGYPAPGWLMRQWSKRLGARVR